MNPVVINKTPLFVTASDGAVRHWVDQVRHHAFDQSSPRCGGGSPFVQYSKSLHCSDDTVPQSVLLRDAPCGKQIVLLCRDHRQNGAVPVFVLANIKVTEGPHSLREGATAGLTSLAPIVVLEQIAFDTRIVLMHAYAGSGKTTTAAEFAR